MWVMENKMKNHNCIIWYKQLRILFPNIGIKEGRFLKDIKLQLRDYSLLHINATYQDIIENFGRPEDIYAIYIESEGIDNIYIRMKKIKIIRNFLFGGIIFAVIIWCLFFAFWYQSYDKFNQSIISEEETDIMEKGEIIP